MTYDKTYAVNMVAWAIHCWECPLCFYNGPEAMSSSGLDHVTSDDMLFASFLVGALGLVESSKDNG